MLASVDLDVDEVLRAGGLGCAVVHIEKQEDREDLSHPVHVDNCLLVSETNECLKEPPAYTHRDYRSAHTLKHTPAESVLKPDTPGVEQQL